MAIAIWLGTFAAIHSREPQTARTWAKMPPHPTARAATAAASRQVCEREGIVAYASPADGGAIRAAGGRLSVIALKCPVVARAGQAAQRNRRSAAACSMRVAAS